MIKYKPLPGIYKLTIASPNHMYEYIGQSSKINNRLNQHICTLKKGLHYNTYLQNVYNKHKNITINVIYCDEVFLTIMEQTYINISKSSTCTNLNIMRADRNQAGWKMEQTTKKKISLALKGNPQKVNKANCVGINHHNYINQTYTFINIFSKEIFIGTRKDFMLRINLHWDKCNQITEFVNAPFKVCYGWMLGTSVPNFSVEDWAKKCRNLTFIFENKTQCFKGTMKEFKDCYNLNTKLTAKDFKYIIENPLNKKYEWQIRPLEA